MYLTRKYSFRTTSRPIPWGDKRISFLVFISLPTLSHTQKLKIIHNWWFLFALNCLVQSHFQYLWKCFTRIYSVTLFSFYNKNIDGKSSLIRLSIHSRSLEKRTSRDVSSVVKGNKHITASKVRQSHKCKMQLKHGHRTLVGNDDKQQSIIIWTK